MNKNFKRINALMLGVMVAAGAAVTTATPVLAENGVQSGTQDYSDNNDGTMKWKGDGKGDIDLTYETSTWDEPGTDPDKTDDNVVHKSGTFLVTIPTAITYTGMKIGTVNTSDDYNVNVRGAIPSGKTVTLTAETGKTLSNGARTADIKETTKQGKTTWSVDECYGGLNKDGSLKGTNTTDNIKMTGEAKANGAYTGTVGYTAVLK